MSVRRAQDESIEGTPDGNTAITAIMDVPDAPTIGAVSDPGTDGYASVAFTAAVTGGTATSFTATSSPGSISASGASSPITVTGLTLNTSYTFTVTGTNSTGTGAASAASSSFTPTAHVNFDSIATVTVGSGGSSSITFSSIPQTYKHLQIRVLQRATDAGSNYTNQLQFNSDTTSANYREHTLYGSGASAVAGTTQQWYIAQGSIPAAGNTSGFFGVAVIDILDYTNTNKNKVTRALSGFDNNGAGGQILVDSQVWLITSAITSITMSAYTSTLAQYSQFALYGII